MLTDVPWQQTMIYTHIDLRDPRHVAVYGWRARDRHNADRYLERDGEIAEGARQLLESAAKLDGRTLIGPLCYSYVPDLGELDGRTRRQVVRMRWRAEPRPWRWRWCVLVQAWQPTSIW